MGIQYADIRRNQEEPEEVTWARTMDEARKKAEIYEKRAAILRKMGVVSEAKVWEKKAKELRKEALHMEVRGSIGGCPDKFAKETREAQEKMLQI